LKKKNTLILLVLLLVLLVNVTSQSDGFASDIQANTSFRWHVKSAPSVGFSFYMTEGGWIAENNSIMTFLVNSIDEDIEGVLTIGNASVITSDTDLSIDLTLGVWGITAWLPGLFVEVGQSNIDILNETAYASAERVQYNFMNGTMTSHYTNIIIDSFILECIVFDYEQDPTVIGAPQITHLAYDLDTGVLVEASTGYWWGEPSPHYILELELDLANNIDSTIILIVLGSVAIIVFAAVILKASR